MRIVLFTMDRLVEFMLPSQVFGTFAFDSNDDEDTKLINIEADNDEWFLYSTTGVRVLDNGNYTYRLKLEINKFYTLERDNVKYLVYIEDAFDNTFMNFKYDQKLKLTIGKGNDCNVNYNIEYINCLANNKDVRAINIIDDELERLEGLSEDEMPEDFELYRNFLNRRRAYVLIDMGLLDEAEEAFKKLLMTDDGKKEYIEQELEYIKELREQQSE